MASDMTISAEEVLAEMKEQVDWFNRNTFKDQSATRLMRNQYKLLSALQAVLAIPKKQDNVLYVPVLNWAQGYNQCLSEVRIAIEKAVGL